MKTRGNQKLPTTNPDCNQILNHQQSGGITSAKGEIGCFFTSHQPGATNNGGFRWVESETVSSYGLEVGSYNNLPC